MRALLVIVFFTVAFGGMSIGQESPKVAGAMLAVGTIGAVVAGIAGRRAPVTDM